MSKVSVIIPTYNRCHLLPQAVKSAQQAGDDVEVIVVDNASTDNTQAVCQSLEGIRYLRMACNGGPALARNAGIVASRAKYLAFLDDDDIRLPDSLPAQISELENNPEAALVYGQVFIGDAECQPTGKLYLKDIPTGDVFLQLIVNNFIPMPSVVIRKCYLSEVGAFDASFTGVEDWDLWLRLAENHPLAGVSVPVAIYRTASSTSGQLTSKPAEILKVAKKVQARALQLPRVVKATKKVRQEVLREIRNFDSDNQVWIADYWLAQGDPRSAFTCLLHAFRLQPIRAARPWIFRLFLVSAINLFLNREVAWSNAKLNE